SLGAYTLTLDHVSTSDKDGNTLVSSVSASTNSELVLRGDTELDVTGNLNVYKIHFAEDTDGTSAVSEDSETIYATPALRVDGTLTATLIYLDGAVKPLIQKPESSTFTLNGASLDVNGDGVKENASVICEKEETGLTVQLLTDEIAAGTKVLTCKYLNLEHYTVIDTEEFEYPTYQNGNYLMVGNLMADKTLEGFTASDGSVVTYKLSKIKYDYTGEAIEPGLILQCNDETLAEGTDYEVSYSDNVVPGTGTITVTAVENGLYTGSGTISFTIRKKSLSSRDIEIIFDGTLSTQTVDGSEVLVPGVKVTDTGREDLELTAGSDYTLSYRMESDGSVSAVLSEADSGYYRGKVVKNYAEVSTATTYTLTNCLAMDMDDNSGEGAVDRENDTELQIQLAVSGDALAGQTNLYVVEMYNQGSEILSYVGNAEAVYSESENSTTLTATLAWDDDSYDAFNSSMMDQYALVTVLEDGYQVISKNSLLVQNPWATAVTTKKYWSYYTYSDDKDDDGNVIVKVQDIESKKGMQGASSYAGDLGVEAEIINIKLNELIKTSTNVKTYGSSAYIPYEYKGKTYYFLNMIAIQDTIYNLNGWGGSSNEYGLSGRTNVTVDLLLAWDSELTYLIHPSARVKGYSYYALNMQEEKARETFEALFCYLGYKLGGSEVGNNSAYKYRVLNWTLGNEVNCCKAWNYSGNLSTSACVANYAEAFQLLYQAISRTDSNARFFISLDHSWTASTEGHSGKSYLDTFAAYMYKTAPQMCWNVNYHPYSQPLTRVDFWNDSSNTTSSTSTKYISMQNLSVLTNYLGTLETNYNMTTTCKAARERESTEKGFIRVILGEQGYTARYGYSSEMSLQVTALQKLHSIAMANTRVDAYTNRSYLDDSSEAASGLYLGLMTTAHKKKSSYAAFKALN
ncbi:MAG: DUF5722 domain-containing protein, partial [Lachnospiraceae bacterium]|nr:DUF5722 domain-containing protein [Lachnospiraceae bacterium]